MIYWRLLNDMEFENKLTPEQINETLEMRVANYWLNGNYAAETLGRPDLVLTQDEREAVAHAEIVASMYTALTGRYKLTPRNPKVCRVYDLFLHIRQSDEFKSGYEKQNKLKETLKING